MFLKAVDSLKNKGVDNILAFSYLNLAEISLLEKDKVKAYDYVNKAYSFIKVLNEDKRWLKYYECKFKIALAYENTVSVNSLKDSIYTYDTKVKNNSTNFNSEELSLNILNENNSLLLKIKKDESKRTKVYFVLVLIILGLIIYYNYKRMTTKFIQVKKEKEESDLKVKKLESELNIMIENMIQKNQKAQSENVNWEKYKLLTKGEWNKFLNTFNQIYPYFLSDLETKNIKLTDAEQRIAVLLKLKLDTQSIMSMLGIGESSVYQSKSRLKKKLNLKANKDLAEYLQLSKK